MVNSRRKGKRIELEAAKAFGSALGMQCVSRAALNGVAGAPDLTGTGPFHVEVKGRRRHACLAHLAQARSAAHGRVPIVLLRQDGDPEFYALLPLHDLGRHFSLRSA